MEGAAGIPETYEINPGAEGLDLAYISRVKHALAEIIDRARPARRLFEIGFGEGSIAAWLVERGFSVTGIDPSTTGIVEARARFPGPCFEAGSAYDDLAARFGTFPIVIAVSVFEHLYSPRKAAETAFALTEPGGIFVCCVPFHGYWKNLVIALTDSFDRHADVMWEHGHIKFFSERSLAKLLTERGFKVERMIRVGRIKPLAKELWAVARRPH